MGERTGLARWVCDVDTGDHRTTRSGRGEHALAVIRKLAAGHIELQEHVRHARERAQDELHVALRPANDEGERVLTTRHQQRGSGQPRIRLMGMQARKGGLRLLVIVVNIPCEPCGGHRAQPVAQVAEDPLSNALACAGVSGRRDHEEIEIGGATSRGALRLAIPWVTKPKARVHGPAGEHEVGPIEAMQKGATKEVEPLLKLAERTWAHALMRPLAPGGKEQRGRRVPAPSVREARALSDHVDQEVAIRARSELGRALMAVLAAEPLTRLSRIAQHAEIVCAQQVRVEPPS